MKKVIDYKTYEELAITTKCYDDKVALPYVVLGLCGEVGELYEKIQQESEKDLIVKEFGDVLWYMAAIRVEFRLKEQVNWPERNNQIANPMTIGAEMGKICEQIKKYLRDDWKRDEDIEFPQKRKCVVQDAWNELLQLLVNLAFQLFSENTMNELGQMNIDKLASRAKRNKIHGEGDLR